MNALSTISLIATSCFVSDLVTVDGLVDFVNHPCYSRILMLWFSLIIFVCLSIMHILPLVFFICCIYSCFVRCFCVSHVILVLSCYTLLFMLFVIPNLWDNPTVEIIFSQRRQRDQCINKIGEINGRYNLLISESVLHCFLVTEGEAVPK